MYRGRLIFPFLIEIAQLDLAASSFDPVFQEETIAPTVNRLGAAQKIETLIRVPGQFYTSEDFLRLQAAPTGNLGKVSLKVLFHFTDLESAGLVEASTGLAKIKVGDRLSAVYTLAGVLVQAVPNPAGAFATKASPIFGLNSSRNLLEVMFQSNDPGSGGA